MTQRRNLERTDRVEEPIYVPESRGWNSDNEGGDGWNSLLSAIDYERFKIAVWRDFHAETGHWPLISMVFHYLLLALFFSGAGMLWYLSDREDWNFLRIVLVGGTAFIVIAFLRVVGESAIYRFERRRYRR